MRNFQKEKKMGYIMQSTPFLIFLGALTIFFSFSLLSLLSKAREVSQNKKITESKVTELEVSKAKLTSEIVKLKTEEGIEENIREKFGLVKEGEKVIVVLKDESKGEANKKTGLAGFLSAVRDWFR